ncbi:hypothetical protein BDW74DRAFT_47056 [Aspergillus multicolor]|uniref:uncharacterized protein n=1 Tax=Aspergillus multicolor TaxID=41759 RepID=UPI003CCD83FB
MHRIWLLLPPFADTLSHVLHLQARDNGGAWATRDTLSIPTLPLILLTNLLSADRSCMQSFARVARQRRMRWLHFLVFLERRRFSFVISWFFSLVYIWWFVELALLA